MDYYVLAAAGACPACSCCCLDVWGSTGLQGQKAGARHLKRLLGCASPGCCNHLVNLNGSSLFAGAPCQLASQQQVVGAAACA